MSKKFKAAIFTFVGIITALLTAICVLTVSNQVRFDKLLAIYDEAIGQGVHEIYDDTAVIEAYKTSDSSKLDEKDKYVFDTASKVIETIIKDGMTDYEKEKAVYDWLFKYVHFDEGSLAAIPSDADNSTPYGVLKSRSSICVGNATTFKLFMDMLGIECKIIHSTEQGEHAWNMVKLDDDWYHCDLTFDGGTDEPEYSVFNAPDSIVSNNGYPYDTSEYPRAEAVKYCYTYQTAQKLEDVYKVPALIKKAIDSGKRYLYIKYEGTVQSTTECSGTVQTSVMSDIIDYIGANYLFDGDISLMLTEKLIDNNILGIIEINGNQQSGSDFDSGRLDAEASKYFTTTYYG